MRQFVLVLELEYDLCMVKEQNNNDEDDEEVDWNILEKLVVFFVYDDVRQDDFVL